MPKLGQQIDVDQYLAKMGYGGMFSDPFSDDWGRDPKNAYASSWDAYEKMLAWDPELAALDQNARLAVLAHDTEIVPATDDAESEKAAEFCIEMVSNIQNWEDIRYDLLDSQAKGLAIIQKNYVRDGGYFTIADTDKPALQTLPQHWFYWKMEGGRQRLIFRGVYGGERDLPLDEELFVIARHGYTAENPYGRGYLAEAFWTFVKKKILQGYMIRLCERGIEVERWAQCAADEVGKDAWDRRVEIEAALANFARYSDAVFPPGVDVHHQPGDSGALQSELNFTRLLDDYMAKVVLGQTLTTDQGRTGTYSQALIHELQQSRKVMSWCKDQMADINDQLLTPICELNFNVGRAKYRIKYEPEEDRKVISEMLGTLGRTFRIRIPKEWAHHTFSVPEVPEEALPEEYYESESVSLQREGQDSGGGGFGEGFGFAEKKNLILAAKEPIDNEVARFIELSKRPVDARLREWKSRIDKSRSYDDLTARIESRDEAWPELADVLRRGAMTAYALGWASQAQKTLRKIRAATVLEVTYDSWEEVVKAFKDKIPISAAVFYALEQELRPKFFATAIAEDANLAKILQDYMAAAITEGQTFSTFKLNAYNHMRAAGYEFPEPYRLETVFRRHLHTADAAAREEWWQEPEVDELLWGFQYITAGDMMVRESHAKLSGTKLPKDHPFWRTCSPPNGYGCRCHKVEIWKTGRTREKEPPEGWAGIPDAKSGFAATPSEMLRGMP